MIRIEKYIFNSFQVNTYFLSDESGECMIIDAGCYDAGEQKQVKDFIGKNKLTLTRSLNTHCHIDHILGNGFISTAFGIGPEYHKASFPFIISAGEVAGSFGYSMNGVPEPARYLEENEKITFGGSTLEVFYTPGHADGSVCFYNKEQGFVITGDVIFRDTIGRTDLPTGNFDLLMRSIREKIFTLPDETVVYAGHGPDTTVGYEKQNNPFIR